MKSVEGGVTVFTKFSVMFVIILRCIWIKYYGLIIIIIVLILALVVGSLIVLRFVYLI